MDVRHLVREERADLAAFLATLTPEEWEHASLCEGWRVRDVVAHVISFDELGYRRFFTRALRAGLSPDRVNAIAVAEAASRSPADLLAALEARIDPRGPITLLGHRPALLDALVHHQDIRRPLARPRAIPSERLVGALRAAFLSPFTGGPMRVRGLRFVATDIEWSRGTGPEVVGAAEAILMAVAGRDTTGELSGEGLAILAARVARPAPDQGRAS